MMLPFDDVNVEKELKSSALELNLIPLNDDRATPISSKRQCNTTTDTFMEIPDEVQTEDESESRADMRGFTDIEIIKTEAAAKSPERLSLP